VRLFLSLVILIHLCGVLIIPNPRSYLYVWLSGFYEPYFSVLGLRQTWGFFAPEPIAPPIYIDYIAERKNAMNLEGRFPVEVNPYFFRDRYNRRLSMSRFIIGSDDNIRNMFMRYTCMQNPDVVSARLWKVTGVQPSVEDVVKNKKRIVDPVEYHIDPLGTYYCPEEKK
jgi:hypothetical protein